MRPSEKLSRTRTGGYLRLSEKRKTAPAYPGLNVVVASIKSVRSERGSGVLVPARKALIGSNGPPYRFGQIPTRLAAVLPVRHDFASDRLAPPGHPSPSFEFSAWQTLRQRCRGFEPRKLALRPKRIKGSDRPPITTLVPRYGSASACVVRCAPSSFARSSGRPVCSHLAAPPATYESARETPAFTRQRGQERRSSVGRATVS